MQRFHLFATSYTSTPHPEGPKAIHKSFVRVKILFHCEENPGWYRVAALPEFWRKAHPLYREFYAHRSMLQAIPVTRVDHLGGYIQREAGRLAEVR